MPEPREIAASDDLRSAFIGVLPHRGQPVRLVRNGDVVSATVARTDGWVVGIDADIDPVSDHDILDRTVRLIWRGDTHAICIEGEIVPGGAGLTVLCDPASVSTLEERARRRVAVRAPVDVTVPTRFVPRVQTTWTVNLSESGVALEPRPELRVTAGEPLVLRMGLDATPVMAVGRVVAADPSQPVRVAFDRMSPTVRGQLIGVVNRLEAASRVHTR